MMGGSLVNGRVRLDVGAHAHGLRAALARRMAVLSGLAFALLLGSAAASAQESLTADEVGRVIAQAVGEASARGRAATIAVVDRVGNVLGVFRMNGATTAVRILDNPNGPTNTGVNGINGPNSPLAALGVEPLILDTAAAIAKAVTGAYLSSSGNAFSTRTASQIIQEHFNVGERFTPGGPLFGVQLSQLPCSDLNVRFGATATTSTTRGPKRSPLGLSGDPGGLPLYKNGVVVGGVGAIADGLYSYDINIYNFDTDDDEQIALAGTSGFDAPVDIRANRISAGGPLLRYVDRVALASNPAAAASFAAINGALGSVVAVPGYFTSATPIAGQAYGLAASGYRADISGLYAPASAFILVDAADANRYAPRAGTDGASALTAAEVQVMVRNALQIATRARAQIRRPLDSSAQVTVTVVDTNGVILGLARTPDAPVFGTDVALQKARSAMFFSHPSAGTDLTATPATLTGASIAGYVTAMRSFVGPAALTGANAITDRAIGNLARPFYPDGVDGSINGPLSRPFRDWSPFSTGLQTDLIADNLAVHLLFVNGKSATDTGTTCTGLPATIGTGGATGVNRLANGLQIFPGSVPIYRGATMVGGIGVSGDGIDQDDMIAFLGLHNASVELGTGVGHAPMDIRSDILTPNGTRLRYVNCPFAAFIGDRSRNVCQDK
jgi:uncharacterized protein GlcG (DUF336 family)